MDVKIYLWLAGMFFVGGIIFSMFGLQISITNNCAMKLYSLVKTSTDLWYPDACLLYFKKVKRRNRVIISALFAVALFLIPLAGFVGLVIGYFFKMLTTAGKTGLNDNNLSDCVSIFTKFAKPGLENDFESVLIDAVCSIKTNNIYRSI